MKNLLFAPLVFAAFTLLHGSVPNIPEFNSKTLGHPPLSLGEITKDATSTKPYQFFGHTPPRAVEPAALRAEPRVNRQSGMPILAPNPAVDYALIVKAPDPAIDFKMIVKPAMKPTAENDAAK